MSIARKTLNEYRNEFAALKTAGDELYRSLGCFRQCNGKASPGEMGLALLDYVEELLEENADLLQQRYDLEESLNAALDELKSKEDSAEKPCPECPRQESAGQQAADCCGAAEVSAKPLAVNVYVGDPPQYIGTVSL